LHIMKYVKSIGLFFVYPLICLMAGLMIGQSMKVMKEKEQQEEFHYNETITPAPPVIVYDEHDVMNPSAITAVEPLDTVQKEELPVGKGFYIGLYNDYVVVYHNDRKTIFLFTDMKSAQLPVDVQRDLAEGIYMKDEGELYDFLENYTS